MLHKTWINFQHFLRISQVTKMNDFIRRKSRIASLTYGSADMGPTRDAKVVFDNGIFDIRDNIFKRFCRLGFDKGDMRF